MDQVLIYLIPQITFLHVAAAAGKVCGTESVNSFGIDPGQPYVYYENFKL